MQFVWVRGGERSLAAHPPTRLPRAGAASCQAARNARPARSYALLWQEGTYRALSGLAALPELPIGQNWQSCSSARLRRALARKVTGVTSWRVSSLAGACRPAR